MGKIIRKTYPVEFSVGLLFLIFAIIFFLSSQIFPVSWHDLTEGTEAYLGMFLVSSAVIIMVLILWEELLFPVRVKVEEHGAVFRNHRTKLKTQVLIYCLIPAIFVFIYLEFEINTIRFFIWAAICILIPIVGKLFSSINNYNDFLRLTDHFIEYKNNRLEGKFDINDIQGITLIKDERKILHKFKLQLRTGEPVTIDLDEMELEAFLESIDKYIALHYKSLL